MILSPAWYMGSEGLEAKSLQSQPFKHYYAKYVFTVQHELVEELFTVISVGYSYSINCLGKGI